MGTRSMRHVGRVFDGYELPDLSASRELQCASELDFGMEF